MTSFVLKLIAAVTMFCDHMGIILFPQVEVLRIIGRIAFPLYAFCIAEGFRYTRNRMRYFLRISILGVLCQIVYCVVEKDLYLGILLTFSFSIILMALVDCVKRSMRGEESGIAALVRRVTGRALPERWDKILSSALTIVCVILLFFLTSHVTVDYGFFGILLPVLTNLFEDRWMRAACFSVGVLAVALSFRTTFSIQFWSLLTIPLVLLYNGKPGRVRMKYFFYVFYPAHMALLYGISMLLHA